MTEIAYQPPPTSPLAASSRQPLPGRILLLVGYPGSGKSTLAECLCRVQPWKFVRVNQDELGSRQKCLQHTQRILLQNDHMSNHHHHHHHQHHQQQQRGYCPIIDRCNLSQSQREFFTELAMSLNSSRGSTLYPPVAVDVIVLQIVDVETCIRRAQARTNNPTMTNPRAIPAIVRGMQRDYEMPNAQQEGLRSVIVVRDEATLQSVVWDLLSQE
jgi:tRNA uridine 5-carbamoylmethylation protein Kti12